MDRKTIGIGFLSLTAAALFVACLLPPKTSRAEFTIKDRDYQMTTMKQQNGDDALYVVDNRTGKMVVFAYEPTRRRIEPKAGKLVADIFSGR